MATYNQSQMTLPSGDVVKFIDNTSGYTKNTGTITGVTAGTGLSGGGTSGAVSLNHSNSVTPQTTQAVYPVEIDAQGHISAYGSAVTSMTPTSHTHGNITNAGDITATSTIASGDRLVINDESASKITNSSITFGEATNTFLANDGTWRAPEGGGTITEVLANGTSVATEGAADIPAASTDDYGVTKLSSAVDSESEVLAATPAAVKAAYDLANTYKGTVTSVRVQATSPIVSSVSTAQTGTLNTTISHSDSGVTAGTYGTATKVPAVTVDAKGHITSVSETTISGVTPASHTHGNLSNDGEITTTSAIATGDKLVIVDSDTTAASKITGSTITFDTSKSGYALTQAGTWAAFTDNVGTITGITTSSPLSGSGTSGSVTISHANSGATAGSYGDEDAQTPSHGGTFKVPYVTVNATGHVTGISEHTVTLPADSNTNYYHAISTTAAATAAKTATAQSYVLKTYNRFTLYISTTNTAQSKLTLNVNSTGAKDVYINGVVSSESNYTWPAGAYQVYYDGTNYHIRTDSRIPGYVPSTESIGSASTGTAISADDITAWTTNTPTAVTKKTVVTSATFNDVVTGGTTTAIPNISKKTVVTGVTFNDVVTGGTTTSLTPMTSKTVVTSASGGTASYASGVLTLTDTSFGTGASVTSGTAVDVYTGLTTGAAGSSTTGDSVTVGTAINAYTTLTTGASGSATTGDSVTVEAGTAASLSFTPKSIPNISVTSKSVVTGLN